MLTDYVEVEFSVRDRPQCHGKRIDAFLADRLRAHSRSYVRKYISEGRVFLRGKAVKPSTRVFIDDVVVVRYPPRNEPAPVHGTLPVVYEDDVLLVVNKPGGLLSHPTGRIVKNSATSILAAQFSGAPVHLAHRLDRETSGLLMLAKKPAYAAILGDQFERREIQKEYLALVFGRTGFEKKIVCARLGYEGKTIRVRQKVMSEDGQEAATEVTSLAQDERMSLVRAKPKTGRLHQIRVHLAHIGHPVVGDKLYFGNGEYFLKAVDGELNEEDYRSLGAPRHMLHAHKIRFRHPVEDRIMSLQAPVPDDFRAVATKEIKGFSSLL